MGAGGYKGVSRRVVFRAGAVAGVGAVSGAVPAEAGGDPGADDLVLHHGEIHTMDDADRVVEVLAVHDGRIGYAGDSLAAARRAVSGRARLVDLRGRTAVPGIIDNHNHLVLMGNRPGRHTPLENAYSVADVAATYRQRAG